MVFSCDSLQKLARGLPAIAFFVVGGAGTASAEIDFNEAIRPLFNRHCVSCHGGVKKASGLSFLSREEALAEGKSGMRAIVPGKSGESHLLERVRSSDPDERMPPPEHGPALSQIEVATLKQWIDEGASWRDHWAFEAPVRPAVPEVSDPDWCQSPVDRFVMRRLDEESLAPNERAQKSALLRRACFDLTGLPPTLDQLDRFLRNDRPDAFASMVQEFLNSAGFGERWAAMWLDLARYADSEGLGVDSRRETWAYRDWVIESFRRNKPFDEFVIEQLAGDQLPHPSTEQLVATAFHRQTQSNGEGGTDDEEFRLAAVMDRTSTTWEVFQGLTFGCVQCHSHPYDPIKNEEYYQFLAFFNNSADADLGDHWPKLRVPLDRSSYGQEAKLRGRIGSLREELTAEVRRRVSETEWRKLESSQVKASSEGNGVRLLDTEEGLEFHSVGNIAAGTRYDFEIRVPADMQSVTALRVDLMPVDEGAARHTPEWGGVLSRIELEMRLGGEEEFKPVELARVLGDEAEPVMNPNESLKKGSGGFGAMSKIFQRRSCVLLPVEPVSLRKGGVLRLRLKHELQALGAFPLVTQRGSLSLSDAEHWTAFNGTGHWENLRTELTEAEKAYRDIPATTVPVMRDRPAHLQRENRLFERGNWLEKGAVVEPGVPAFLPPLPPEAPRNRLALAKWLVSEENPLTARVAVNRFWEQLFGYGIVMTLEDLGSAGEKPSHPELLDWLAVYFRDDLQWDVKELLRTIVLSSTYQQEARASAAMHERDPLNRLMARGPRRRLKAEMIRDAALSVGGLLSKKQFGPPVRPPLPGGVWKPFSNDPWKTDEDDDRFRRAVYVYWKRSIPFPSLVTFDAPSRELCNQRRLPSNTPLQALVTLNDPVFVEAANALAERMREHDSSLVEQLRYGHRLCTSRFPEDARLREMLDLYAQLENTYEREKVKDVPDIEIAALRAVASVLLNLDESLSK